MPGGDDLLLSLVLRWQQLLRGLIAPDEFLRRAELSGVITGLGEWVLTQACRDTVSWERMVIELVETDYNVQAPLVTDNLAALAALGVKLAIDDFGTSYSSMNRLISCRCTSSRSTAPSSRGSPTASIRCRW